MPPTKADSRRFPTRKILLISRWRKLKPGGQTVEIGGGGEGRGFLRARRRTPRDGVKGGARG